MSASTPVLLSFNRGRLSPLALARVDFKRTALSADVQTNFMPRVLGSMMLRPGLQWTGNTRANIFSVTLPFVKAIDDTARIELTNDIMRIWVDDVLVERPAVSSAVTNGYFLTDLTGWSDQDGGSAVSSWLTGGFLSLVGTTNAAAKRRQEVTVTDTGIRHALDIEIERGPVLLRVGSTAGDDDYITETTLQAGSHSLAFTPAGNFWIDLFSYTEAASLVASINIAPVGVMEVPSPWQVEDLRSLRWDQSGDVVFVASANYRQRRIERRAVDSWSIVVYQSDDGPFRILNTGPITLTPSAVSGDITLTASQSLFRTGHVGALFRLTQTGQSQDVELTADNQFSDPIRVVGVDAGRIFAVIITGTWAATITLQYSISEPGSWIDATSGSFTTNVSETYDDTLDNQVIYYRIGIKAGNYTSGTATALLSLSAGSQTGIARVTEYTSATVVNAAVLDEFAFATATADWSESYWSGVRGYPSSVALYEGRLWWAGKDRIWGSVSDDFSSFDDGYEGDAGPISRSIGAGPVDTIHWLVPAQRLLLGAAGSIFSARSSSFDEPLTPTNFNLKDVSTQGAAAVNAVKIDTSALFLQRAGVRVYEAGYDGNSYDYAISELTSNIPEIGEPSIVRLGVQRKPETRIHCVRDDGTVAVMIIDKQEEVNAWIDIETPGADGFVEDVVVLPGAVEDQVYYTVQRAIDGQTVRFHEKWAMESECQGGLTNRQADAFIVQSGAIEEIDGLDHLEGCEVVCWADGVDRGTFTVTDGSIPQGRESASVVGLPYTARYRSTKLAYGAQEPAQALCQKKRVSQLGIIAQNMHPQGLRYGPSFDFMDDLPGVELADDVDQAVIHATYDEEMFEFSGEWSTDSRLCLEASAPRPVTLLACVMQMETNSK